ncbi:glycosyltransferase [Prosthecobacter sp. SYSU 5D2]|uniref:glycosyltransferase n=1 Tax=Prosthecobacter sp. SYSU 5D2 TaxID=3134134 RepID=UPI0031FEAA52
MRRGTLQSESPAPPTKVSGEAQIIGLIKNRLSGITLSRHAYADVLRRIYPDLMDSTVEESARRDCKLNVWAARPLSHGSLDAFTPMPGFNVWCLVLESTVLPDRSLEAAANADQVWVPTSFCRDVCVANGMPPEKVHVVPYYLPAPARPCRPPSPHDPFTVLLSWDGKSNMSRKNVLKSIQAFKLAWPKDLDVRMKLKTRDLSQENTAAVKEAIACDGRIILDDSFAPEVDDIFDGVHCLMHCHRAEGYGRHVMEAMLRRVPVIATAYSGPMDWLTNENSLRVGYHLVETSVQEYRYPQGGQWAEPDIGDMVAQLRACQAESMEAMTEQAQHDAQRACSMEQSMHAMLTALKKGGHI